jgi:8-oxo-dGTP pyrophosphatase MutT (NUDIX family)
VIVKHGTSSVFVLHRTPEGWRIGLIRHPRYDRMMLPGGHVEPEETPEQAAIREVAEESGLAVTLVGAPAPPLPAGYQPPRVEPPWWMVEYDVPADDHAAGPHVHIDHLYVGLADGLTPVGAPAHPFDWYAAADLPGLYMFEDTGLLALAVMAGLADIGQADGAPAAAILARLEAGGPRPGQPAR